MTSTDHSAAAVAFSSKKRWVETLLKDRYGVTTVVRHAKPSPTRVAKPEIRQDVLSRCHGVIEAVSS